MFVCKIAAQPIIIPPKFLHKWGCNTCITLLNIAQCGWFHQIQQHIACKNEFIGVNFCSIDSIFIYY